MCVLVCCVMCMLGMSASPPSEPENTRTHTGGEEEGSVAKMRRKYRSRNDCCWFVQVFPGTLNMPPGSVFKRSMFLRIGHLVKESVNF